MAGQAGSAIGLTIGCIIGMFPLLLIDTEAAQMRKQHAKVDAMFRDVVTEAKTLVSAESTCLILIVDDETSTLPSHYKKRHHSYEDRHLYGKYSNESSDVQNFRMPVGRGIVSKAIVSGQVLNIEK